MLNINIKYPAFLTKAEASNIVITFRDFPEMQIEADTKAEALQIAEKALLTCVTHYLRNNCPVPIPSQAQSDDWLFTLPIPVATKILLVNEIFKQKQPSCYTKELLP